MSTHYGITMPHFEAAKLVVMTRKTVPPGLTLEDVFEAMKGKQFPIRFKKGAVSYEIGQVVTTKLGRDSIVVDIGLDPNFELIVEKLTEIGDGEEPDKDYAAVKYLEWTT